MSERFASLFRGRTDVHGCGHGECVRREPTQEDFAAHLAGENSGLGTYPLLDDGTCRWAAVDFDSYELLEVAQDTASFLPGVCWLERSKSKGYHLLAFFSAPIMAIDARAVLLDALTRAMGDAKAARGIERFPKADRLRPGSVGSYLNLPLHGDGRPIIWKTGDPYTSAETQSYAVETFLEAAEANLTDPASWEHRAAQIDATEAQTARAEDEATSTFGQRSTPHRCATYALRHAHDNPIRPGHRNPVFWSLACQLANCEAYDEDEVVELVDQFNNAGTEPVPRREIEEIVGRAYASEMVSSFCDDPEAAEWMDPNCERVRGAA